jgi:hypothetical protein
VRILLAGAARKFRSRNDIEFLVAGDGEVEDTSFLRSVSPTVAAAEPISQ